MITLKQDTRRFSAEHSALAFPLGGIGTGNVSIGARGDLLDWEIFNQPAKGTRLPNTFFAIRTKSADGEVAARVLEGQIPPPYTLSHGFHPVTGAGLPRFRSTTFCGEYPFAQIDLSDDAIPVDVRLEAFTPLIPLNPDDSGIPCAILTYAVTNTGDQALDVTLVGSLCNPVGGMQMDRFSNLGANLVGRTRNEFHTEQGLRGLHFGAEGIDPNHLQYGNMSLVTDHAEVTVKPAWMRSGWWDFLQDFWDDFVEDGLLEDYGYTTASENGKPDIGSLGLVDTLEAGETKTFRFVLTWYFPNRLNTWSPQRTDNFIVDTATSGETQSASIVPNHYAKHFDDAWDVARYVIDNYDRLYGETAKFHDALFSTSLPADVLERLAANIVPVRSNTCFWLEDGRFYGWEGCFDDAGCCPGSCTHVWSYTYTVAYLFPSLEREMRRIEFEIETQPDGFMNFRNFASMGEQFVWTWGDQPEAAVDGQMGSILRAYREWQLSGDRGWLGSIWEGIKRAIGYATVQWDTDGDGILDGKQHNTYDIEFYGVNPLSSIYYLAALRAVEQLALVMGEDELSARCKRAFESTHLRLDELLWNGEYFIQKIDDVDQYKYQHGLGCLSDQLLGQLHAEVLGLGDLLPREHIQHAIKAIYDNNFRESFGDHVNCQRSYVLNDEAGLVMCTWNHGGRPKLPFVYSDEVWTGVEYHVAAHLIAEGWTAEGLRIIEAIQDRHDGIKRNPYDEVECGHHYARTMSSWTVLLAASGFYADVNKGEMSFDPVMGLSTDQNAFSTFWSNGKAWGTVEAKKDVESGEWSADVTVLGGELENTSVTVNGVAV